MQRRKQGENQKNGITYIAKPEGEGRWIMELLPSMRVWRAQGGFTSSKGRIKRMRKKK